MKKNIFKKIAASLATVAMAVGVFAAMPASDAKAADELYATGGFCGWSWDNCVTLSTTDGNVYTGEIEVSGDTEICIKTVQNWDNDADKVTYKYNGTETQQTNVAFASAGKYELTYNKTTMELTTKAKTTVQVNWTYTYVVAGNPELGAADWTGDVTALTAGVMTEKDGKYTLTTTTTATGDFKFKIVKVGTPDVEGIDKKADWIGDPDNDGQDFKVKVEDNKITFTFDAATNKVTVAKAVETPTQPETSSKEESSSKQEETSTKTEETTTKTEETTTKTEETKPNTGDSSSVVLMIAVAAVAAGAVVVSRRRTVSE